MISWVYFRMYEFPTRVILNGACEGVATRCPDQQAEIETRPVWFDGAIARYHQDCVPNLWTNISLLWTLFVLHCWWFFLLCRIGYSIIAEGVDTASKQNYEGDMDTKEGGDAVQTSSKTKKTQ